MAKWLRIPATVFDDTRLALCGDQALLLLLALLSLNERHNRGGVLTPAESDPVYLSRVCRLWDFGERVGELLSVLEREGLIWREGPDSSLNLHHDLVAGKVSPDHQFGAAPAAPPTA
jgi:hypothetical protein